MSNGKNEREPWEKKIIYPPFETIEEQEKAEEKIRLECEKAEEEREREELTNKLNESLKKLDSYEEAEKEWLIELFMERGIYQ